MKTSASKHSKGPGRRRVSMLNARTHHLMWFAHHRARALEHLSNAQMEYRPERAARLMGWAREQAAAARKEFAAAFAKPRLAA